MAKEEKKLKDKSKGLWAEFKAFINRGNAFMLAVGVVIGGAFSAIVNSLVNILLSVVTWTVPGGLKGLVTVLPAVNDAQKGLDGIGQYFSLADLQKAVVTFAENQGATVAIANGDGTYTVTDAAGYASMQTALLGKYTLHGTTYTYNMSAVIDWGTFINAIISFLIIALTLFIIVKVVNSVAKKKEALELAAREAYYEKHPEERPVPPEPGVPEPTEKELLAQILAELKKNNGAAPEAK